MAQKVLINGTAYELKPSPVLIDGTKYQIGGGRTLVNGTGYDVKLSNSPTISLTGYNHIVNGTPAWKVTVDGTEYTSAGTEIEVESGTEVTVTIQGGFGYIGHVSSKQTGYIKFNGTVISGGNSGGYERTASTYTFSVTADCKMVCEGTMVGMSSAQGIVEITM